MAVYKLARFAVREDAQSVAERAMHDFASYVRNNLPGYQWTTYRETGGPARYVALIRVGDPAEDGVASKAFDKALGPHLDGPPELTEWELVTSSDLAPRPKSLRRSSR